MSDGDARCAETKINVGDFNINEVVHLDIHKPNEPLISDLENNGIEINSTYEALVSSLRDELEFEVAKVLFS